MSASHISYWGKLLGSEYESEGDTYECSTALDGGTQGTRAAELILEESD